MQNPTGSSAGRTKIRLAAGDDCDRIARYLDRSPSSSIYHDFAWSEVIERSFGHKTFYLLYERQDGGIGGILPLVHLRSLFFGNMLVSMPYFNYGGVRADTSEIRDGLIGAAIGIAQQAGASHMELRQEDLLGNGFPFKSEKVSMRIQLPQSPDQLWKSFPSKLRSQVKGSMKNPLTTRIGRGEELDHFYHVFAVNMRHLGTPVYPKRFFANILRCFPDRTWISSVFYENVPVASGFLIGFKDTMEVPWASSLRKYNRFGANMLLYWTALRFSCEKGFRVFDFGRSTIGEGTYRFKEQWGATPYPMRWHYWLRSGNAVPEITPRNPKYRLAIEIWKRLPVSVTRIVGPHIVKNIP